MSKRIRPAFAVTVATVALTVAEKVYGTKGEPLVVIRNKQFNFMHH